MPLLPSYPGVPSGIVDGPDEMRRKVRELHRMGANVIKVATSGGVLSPRDDPRHAHFRPEELDVLVTEATAAGMFVMAHAQAADGIKNAVRAGIRSIEHGIFLDDEGIELMLDRGTWLVPDPRRAAGGHRRGRGRRGVSAGRARQGRSASPTSTAGTSGVRSRPACGSRWAPIRGVAPHGRNLRELELMAGLGMAPAAVLEATTRSAAQLLGVDRDLGTIEPGKLADLVLVDGDPYAFDTLPQRIEGVWLAGRAASRSRAPAGRLPPRRPPTAVPGAAWRSRELVAGIGLSGHDSGTLDRCAREPGRRTAASAGPSRHGVRSGPT